MRNSDLEYVRSRADARHFREVVIERANGRCEVCGFWAGPIVEVHHVVQASNGGSGWPENLIALCPNCHGVVTALRRARNQERARSIGMWLDECTGYALEQARLLIELAYENVVLTGSAWERGGVWQIARPKEFGNGFTLPPPGHRLSRKTIETSCGGFPQITEQRAESRAKDEG